MNTATQTTEDLVNQEYKYGFVTEIETDTVPRGLNEAICPLDFGQEERTEFHARLASKGLPPLGEAGKVAGRAKMGQRPLSGRSTIRTSSTTRRRRPRPMGLKSLDEVDPKLLETYDKLGIPLLEQKWLTGVAVDAVFDSVSVATTFKEKLAELGIIFCLFSEAVQKHPVIVKKYLGSVVPYSDNFFAALNAAVFSDGSFCYIPKGVRCPMELSTYFRINAAETGPV